jgi:hypothetical protein
MNRRMISEDEHERMISEDEREREGFKWTLKQKLNDNSNEMIN